MAFSRRDCAFLVVMAILATVSCRHFTAPELARELKRLNVSDWDIPTLVCLAYNASHLDTSYVSTRHDLPYTYHGIFGIPDGLFDSPPCDHLHTQNTLNDDITDDVLCVRKLIDREFPFPNDRIAIVQVLTQHDVDLSKCFTWWESLPPYMDTMAMAAELKSNDESSTTVCRCSSSNAMTNVLIFFLDLSLIALVAMAVMMFRQRNKGVNYFSDRISNHPLV